MSDERNLALTEREELVNDYLRGLYDCVPVGKEYAKGVQEVKRLFAKTLPYYAKSEEEISLSNEKERIIISILGFVGWMILYILFPKSGFMLRTIGMVALVIAFYQTTKNAIWTVVPLTIHFSFGFIYLIGELDEKLALENYLVLVILLFYFIDSLKKMFSKIKMTALQNRFEQKLKKQQDKLKMLIPSMRTELKELQDNWFEKYKHVLTPEDKECYTNVREEFPPAFWWEMPLEIIKSLAADVFGNPFYDAWETKLIKRKEGNEFQATDEYSPLYLAPEEDEQVLMKFYREEMQCDVYDAISRYVSLEGARGQTVQYETYKHDAVKRVGVELSVLGIAKDIDDAYNSRGLSDEDYIRLNSLMYHLGKRADDYVNEKENHEYVEYMPVRACTYMWTGQFMVMNWRDKKGRNHCVIRQYYCQLPHLIKNIKALYEMPIDQIDYDPFTCNPYFLSCFYAAFPYCL